MWVRAVPVGFRAGPCTTDSPVTFQLSHGRLYGKKTHKGVAMAFCGVKRKIQTPAAILTPPPSGAQISPTPLSVTNKATLRNTAN